MRHTLFIEARGFDPNEAYSLFIEARGFHPNEAYSLVIEARGFDPNEAYSLFIEVKIHFLNLQTKKVCLRDLYYCIRSVIPE